MVWAGGLDARYVDAMQRPYRAWGRIDVYDRQGVLLRSDLPFVTGAVTVDLARRVVRQLSFTLGQADPAHPWFPATPLGTVDAAGLLAPFGNRVRAWAGIEYGDGTRAEFPIFTGRIEDVDIDDAGQVVLSCMDLAAEVVSARFETPQSSVASNTVYQEWQRLIQDALPDATFGVSDIDAAMSPIGALSWEQDRGQALDDMVAGVGCLWWCLADGSFVLRRQPWSAPDRTPVMVIGDGSAPSSARRIVSRYRAKLSREGVANSVVYASERLDGSAPLVAIARDEDPLSPTFWGGNFGHQPVQIQNQAPLTQAQTQYAAQVQLRYAKSLAFRWSGVSILSDPSLEAGDLLRIVAGGLISDQVASGFTVPLREGSIMPLNLRAYVPLVSV